jgi:hypothetical protein
MAHGPFHEFKIQKRIEFSTIMDFAAFRKVFQNDFNEIPVTSSTFFCSVTLQVATLISIDSLSKSLVTDTQSVAQFFTFFGSVISPHS